jgi:hypothetical protein
MRWKPFCLSLTLLLLTSPSFLAQTSDAASPPDEQDKQQQNGDAKKELERKTLALLDEIISSTSTLKLPENRALIMSSAADLLWSRDGKRARQIFKDALNGLGTNALKFDDKMSAEQYGNYWMLSQQRKEILQLVAHHDPDLALELLRSSRPPAPEAQREKRYRTDGEEVMLERNLEIQIADKDPKRAYQMAKDKLSRGFSFEAMGFLNRLNNNDPELAIRLADEIISKLRTENLATNQEATQMALMLVLTGKVRNNIAFATPGPSQDAKAPFSLNERQFHDLLDAVTSTSFTALTDPPYTYTLAYLMPEIKKQFPERALALHNQIVGATNQIGSEQVEFLESMDQIQTNSEEALMERAAKSSDYMRDALYIQAATKALLRSDWGRARQIVADNVKNPMIRERMLESIENLSLQDSIKKENLDEVREKLSHLKSKDRRANTLTQLALATALKGDQKLALELLDEAFQFVNFDPKNTRQVDTLLGIARVYAIVKPAKAFEILESLCDRANGLLSAASALNGFFIPPRTFRQDELVLPSAYSSINSRFRDFGKQLAALALIDFDRTKALANKLQRDEARIIAQLFITQSVLSEQLGSGGDIDPVIY